MQRHKQYWVGGVMFVAGVLCAFLAANPWASAVNNPDSGPPQLTEAELQNLSHANSLSQAFRSASNRVLPAVVTIRTEMNVQNVDMGADDGEIPEALRNDPFFRRFFEDLPDAPRRGPRQPRLGMGSGVIIDADGLILTNNHVVRDGAKVTVRLHDGREFVAESVKSDPRTDLAIVKIESDAALPYATIGNSDAMEVGDWVIAVGAPFRLQESVTAGIVSGKSRVVGINEREEYIQTDAAINPGNSGGPLINLAGEIVGINTAISSTSGGYQGIGFAIPSNLAKWVADQLRTNGEVKRAYLGVLIKEVNSKLAEQLGLDRVQGALIAEVQKEGPAAAAGVQPGDVAVEFAGRPIVQPSDLQGLVEKSPVGSRQELVVVRDGSKKTLTVEVEALPERLSAADFSGSSDSVQLEELGLTVDELSEETATKLGLEGVKGVLVTQVASGSIAERAGIAPSYVITKIGRTPIESVEALVTALEKFTLDDGLVMTVRTTDGSKILFLGR